MLYYTRNWKKTFEYHDFWLLFILTYCINTRSRGGMLLNEHTRAILYKTFHEASPGFIYYHVGPIRFNDAANRVGGRQ